jgi:hypothetical protein
MTHLTRRKLLLAGLAGPALLGASGCAYILYPERKGRTGGQIDPGPFIVDLIWLLPGIIPGVICLIVDFTTGCVYRSPVRAADVAAPAPAQRPAIAVAVDGAVVADAEWRPDSTAHLRWNRAVDDSTLRARGRVIVRRHDGAAAQADVSDLI